MNETKVLTLSVETLTPDPCPPLQVLRVEAPAGVTRVMIYFGSKPEEQDFSVCPPWDVPPGGGSETLPIPPEGMYATAWFERNGVWCDSSETIKCEIP